MYKKGGKKQNMHKVEQRRGDDDQREKTDMPSDSRNYKYDVKLKRKRRLCLQLVENPQHHHHKLQHLSMSVSVTACVLVSYSTESGYFEGAVVTVASCECKEVDIRWRQEKT